MRPGATFPGVSLTVDLSPASHSCHGGLSAQHSLGRVGETPNGMGGEGVAQEAGDSPKLHCFKVTEPRLALPLPSSL